MLLNQTGPAVVLRLLAVRCSLELFLHQRSFPPGLTGRFLSIPRMPSFAFPANIPVFLADEADVPIGPSEPRDWWQNNVPPAAASRGRAALCPLKRMLLSPDKSFPLSGTSGYRRGRRLDWNASPSLKKKERRGKKLIIFCKAHFLRSGKS